VKKLLVDGFTIVTAGDGARMAINLINGRQGQRYVWHDVLPPRPQVTP
jgi:hypothetical protein